MLTYIYKFSIKNNFFKSLKLSPESRNYMTSVETINLMKTHTESFINFSYYFHVFWGSVLKINIAFVLLWFLIGPSSLVALIVIIIFIPINLYFMKESNIAYIDFLSKKEERIKIINELIDGIKVDYFEYEYI